MKKLQKGFTLIELMIVVAIIAILAAVAAPRFGAQIARTRDARAVSLAGTWQSALTLNYSTDEVYATSFGALVGDVDDATVQNSFNEEARTNNVTTASGDTIFTRGGTSDLDQNSVGIEITGTSTNSAINFTSESGINTREVRWDEVLFQ